MNRELKVANSKGLHGRPATIFAETAAKFGGEVKITYGKKSVNGKSLIALMAMAVPCGGEVVVELSGDGAEAMMEQLETVLATDYEG